MHGYSWTKAKCFLDPSLLLVLPFLCLWGAESNLCFYPRRYVLKKTCKTQFSGSLYFAYVSFNLSEKEQHLCKQLWESNSQNNFSKHSIETSLCSCPTYSWDSVDLLHNVWYDAMFFIRRKTRLIAHWCFSGCWVVLHRNKDASVSCTALTVRGHKELGGDGTRAAKQNWARVFCIAMWYSVPHGIMQKL